MLRSASFAGVAFAALGLCLPGTSALAQPATSAPAPLSSPEAAALDENSDGRSGGGDMSCRSEAASRTGYTGAGDSQRTAQRYAAIYYQCMAQDDDNPAEDREAGNDRPPSPPAYAPAYAYDPYPYGPYYYPPYYGPLFVPSLSFGFGFGGGFHHGGFAHHR